MRIAAIDAGTNSFHLLVAQVTAAGVLEPLERAKEMVRLGDHAFTHGILPEASDRGLAAMRRFQAIADRLAVDALVAVATSAVREAENGGDFVRLVRDETEIEIHVIGGDEEARLIYTGAKAYLSLGGRRALFIDVGGGSVELIVGDALQSYLVRSLKLGVLRILEKNPISDPIQPLERARLAEYFHRTLAAPIAEARQVGFDTVVMTAGTARAVADILAPVADRNTERVRRILFRDLYQFEDRLSSVGAHERCQLGIDTRRVDSIVPGAILMRSALELAHVDDFVFCDAGLREGVIFDYVNRHRPDLQLIDEIPDLRRRSVMQLLRRYHADEKHAEHVAKLALALFRGTRRLHDMANSEGELLEFSALLHDIGFHIATSKHHKHAAYLIANSDMKGFSQEEIVLIAQVARYHRKSTPKDSHEPLSRLPVLLRDQIRKLAALLRIADGLDRGYAQRVRSVRVEGFDPVEVVLAAHGDVEIEVWGARRKRDLFEEIFSRKVRFTVEEVAA